MNRITKTHIIKLLFLLNLQLFASCKNEDQSRMEIIKGDYFQIFRNDTLTVEIKLYENGTIKSTSSIDSIGNKNGPQMEYYPNGVLKKKYFSTKGYITGEYSMFNDRGEIMISQNYIDGVKSGNMWEYAHESLLKSHILYDNGHAIFVGAYEKGEKIISSILPIFEREEIRNDSIYEAKIEFPFPFKGNIKIYFKDTLDFKKEYTDKYNLNLTITNFDKSWKNYEMLIEYLPAENDSLVWTEQVYKRTINID